MLADERDAIEEKLQRKEEPYEKVAIAVDWSERRNWGCFDASLVVANLGFHVDLVWKEKSLHVLYLATHVNNVSYKYYVIFVT